VLAVFRDEAVLAQVRAKAPRLRAAVDAAAAKSPGATRPRALGLIAALDLAGGGYLGEAGWRVYDHALARGAILRPLGDTVYLAPPLTISDADLAELCDTFVAAVHAASGCK
jgi:adenosylmethionine---8-amino-7-oxononanoate aminotransferase